MTCSRCHKDIGDLQPYFTEDDGTVLCYQCKRDPQPVERVKGAEG